MNTIETCYKYVYELDSVASYSLYAGLSILGQPNTLSTPLLSFSYNITIVVKSEEDNKYQSLRWSTLSFY
jgi:hypothetical protein